MKYEDRFKGYYKMIEDELAKCFDDSSAPQARLFEAMRYSLLAGGKRIRPVLALEFCRVCGGDVQRALPFACAVEMVHTYSLIHDDLPCMDDDDLRRGRPTNHKVYGEAMAVLAGDALLTAAFEKMLSKEAVGGVSEKQALEAARVLAGAAGELGMVGGQTLDILGEGNALSIDDISLTHALKTGALISAAVEIGCITGGAGMTQKDAARGFAQKLGLAFQIRDDILDADGSSIKLGKPVGRDWENNKTTFVALLGVEKCREEVKRLTNGAKDDIRGHFEDCDFLFWIADFLSKREI